MARTDNLRRQHDAVSGLLDQIDDQLARYEAPEDAFRISLSLAKLVGILRIHLAQEDRHLYPAMIASDRPETAALAQRFAREMGSLGEAFGAFAGRWSSSAVIDQGIEEFRRDARAVFNALRKRIARENAELYPLADALIEPTTQHAA